MKKHPRILVIGTGHMAQCIIQDIAANNPLGAKSMTLITGESPGKDKAAVKRQLPAKTALEVTVVGRNEIKKELLLHKHDIVLFCAKPQQLEALRDYNFIMHEGALVISIAAGKTMHDIALACGMPVRTARIMPHIPRTIYGIYAENAEQQALITKLLAAYGSPVLLQNEEQFVPYSVHAGSGPAFAARFIERLHAEGIETGNIIDNTNPRVQRFYDLWLTMAQRDFSDKAEGEYILRQTLAGTTAYLQSTHINPADFCLQVRSAKGVTNAGLIAMGSPPPHHQRFGTPDQLESQSQLAQAFYAKYTPEESIVPALLATTQRLEALRTNGDDPLGGINFNQIEIDAEKYLRTEFRRPDQAHG